MTEPEGAALLSGKPWASHKIGGWAPDFIPEVLSRKVYDQIVLVSDVEARDAARELATQEGIFCGISSGGTFAAARKVAAQAPAGSVLLAMLPDTGERYLSTFHGRRRHRRRLGSRASVKIGDAQGAIGAR